MAKPAYIVVMLNGDWPFLIDADCETELNEKAKLLLSAQDESCYIIDPVTREVIELTEEKTMQAFDIITKEQEAADAFDAASVAVLTATDNDKDIGG